MRILLFTHSWKLAWHGAGLGAGITVLGGKWQSSGNCDTRTVFLLSSDPGASAHVVPILEGASDGASRSWIKTEADAAHGNTG